MDADQQSISSSHIEEHPPVKAGPSYHSGPTPSPAVLPPALSARSLTPPLTLEQQVLLLREEINNIKQSQVGETTFSWQNIPSFDPNVANIQLNKWLRLIEEKSYFSRWDDVSVTRFAISKLSGRALQWYLSSEHVFNNWNDLKTALRNTFDIDTTAIGTLFKDAANYGSSQHNSLVQYYSIKLNKLQKLNWDIPIKDMVNIIIHGLDRKDIKHMALLNNYQTLEDLLTYFRSIDQNLPVSSPTRNTGSTTITCYYCHQSGHVKYNCPKKKRNTHFPYTKEEQPRNYCKLCNKSSHNAQSCRRIKKSHSQVKTINTICNQLLNLYYKDVLINNTKLVGIIDTGSECSLIKHSVTSKLKLETRQTTTHFLRSFSGEVHLSNIAVTCEIFIDSICDSVEFLVVPDYMCPTDVLLGNNFISQPHLAFYKNGTGIKFLSCVNFARVTTPGSRTPLTASQIKCYRKESEVLELLNKYRDCVATNLGEMGKTTTTQMEIKLVSSTPVVYNPYRLSDSQRSKVKDIVNELLRYGIIRESQSPYASPIILVPKKDGSPRLCVDYRKLNSLTVKQKFPLPRIDDQLDKLLNFSTYITLDLYSGYFQVPMAPEAIPLTAFITPDGKYEFLRMSFGLCNSPAVFQHMMSKILSELNDTSIIPYLDDILIPAKSTQEGLVKLERVLQLLRKHNLTLQINKCTFFAKHLTYLGHEISNHGVQPDTNKITAILNLPMPKTKKQLRQFLGLSGFFRKFIKSYAMITQPLTQLLKKNALWSWTKPHSAAVDTIKQRITTKPILKIFDPVLPTELHTDASSLGVGAVLLQNHAGTWYPTAYFSKQCSYEESKYHSYELETMAIVFALRHFRIYLLGIQFTIFTDCAAIRATAQKKDLIPRIARWWLEIQDYTFEIQYRPGKKMGHVDYLSRNPQEVKIGNIINLTESDWIRAVQVQDETIQNIINILSTPKCNGNKTYFDNYIVKGNLLYRKVDATNTKWVVPKGCRWLICRLNHDDAGHFAFQKTLDLIRRHYWFKGMARFVKKYVNACLNCLYSKSLSGAKAGLLHPIPKAKVPFETLHIDHLGPFVKSKKNHAYILVIVDGFTKFTFITPVRNTKVKYVVKALEDIIYLFGPPARIISDRGTAFTSHTMTKFCNELGIKHILNAVATPRANGQCERFNKTILESLRCYSANDSSEDTWDTHLKRIQFSINSARNSTTGESPLKVLIGINPRPLADAKIIEKIGDDLGREDLECLRNRVSNAIETSQRRSKRLFDMKRKLKKFKENDLVMVLRTSKTATGQSTKLQPTFTGPFRIRKVLPNDRYVVQDLRGHSGSETVIAVDGLKPWVVMNDPESQPF